MVFKSNSIVQEGIDERNKVRSDILEHNNNWNYNFVDDRHDIAQGILWIGSI